MLFLSPKICLASFSRSFKWTKLGNILCVLAYYIHTCILSVPIPQCLFQSKHGLRPMVWMTQYSIADFNSTSLFNKMAHSSFEELKFHCQWVWALNNYCFYSSVHSQKIKNVQSILLCFIYNAMPLSMLTSPAHDFHVYWCITLIPKNHQVSSL